MIRARSKLDTEKYIFSNLKWTEDSYKTNISEILKKLAFLLESAEELKEHFNIYNGVCQIKVRDDEFNFWVKIHEGELKYQLGIYKNPLIELSLTKSTMLQIAKKKLTGIEAYMKGLVLMRGNLLHLYSIKNCVQLVCEYTENCR